LNIQEAPLFVQRLKESVTRTQTLHVERPKVSAVSQFWTTLDYALMKGFWLLCILGLFYTVYSIFVTFFSRLYTYARWIFG
jgi:hypothetical protein